MRKFQVYLMNINHKVLIYKIMRELNKVKDLSEVIPNGMTQEEYQELESHVLT